MRDQGTHSLVSSRRVLGPQHVHGPPTDRHLHGGSGLSIPPVTDGFLSYSRFQSGLAGELVAALREGRVACWLDRLGIGPGERWCSALREGIAGSDNFLVLLDQAWLRSPVCREEYELACQYGKTLVPVVAEDVSEARFRDHY